MTNVHKIFISLILLVSFTSVHSRKAKELILVTVATHITDGFQRFNRSVNVYGLKLEVLGLDQPWNGGDVARRPGGGQKIRLLKDYLESVQDQDDLLIVFTDSYDVIINGQADDIIKRFNTFDADVVFSSEKYCWPDPSLASQYPKADGQRYLNSGGFIGFAPELYSITTLSDIKDDDDDQLYYTNVYLNDEYRKKFNIKLDRNCVLFQNLNGDVSDVEIRFTQGSTIDYSNADAHLYNKVFYSEPIIVHGNGASKIPLNSLGNYLAKSWHPATGCLNCNENRFDLHSLSHEDYPHVLIAINILKPTPFFPEFLEYITSLDYYKDKITILIQSSTDYHSQQIDEFVDNFKSFYRDLKAIENLKIEEWKLRNSYLDECVKIDCDYLFVIDHDARLTNSQVLNELIIANKSIIAPMLVRPKEYWSNFWGTITHDGFYSRSHDYIQIIQNERRGIWNVPFISSSYLINANILLKNNINNLGLIENNLISYDIEDNGDDKSHNSLPIISYRDPNSNNDDLDADMFFCNLLRKNGIFMFVTNLVDYGHLANVDTMDISLKNPEMYEIYTNEIEWKKRYIHDNYTNNFLNDTIIEQPCPDVFWFPVVKPIFCQHLIEIMENYGQWSSGTNQDPRLATGYENVPTRDIHMNQVGLEQHWLYFLRQYIRPVQEKIFTGYYNDPPKAIMNFVVRYHPNEQANLRPHHDASTYTINIALNRPKIDYEGGGCRFVRYNCSITNLRLGWSLIHPGRLTHLHEGLTVTKGVRYIMVSFVDP